MADATQTIAIEALWDGTRLKAGTEEAERSMETLADQVETSSREIQDSLQRMDDGVTSTLGVGGTFSRSVDDVEAEGSRMSGIGSEIGAEFSENIGEGFRSGDFKGVILETFTSLGPALGVAGIGIGLGAALLNGMVSAADAKRQEFVDSVNAGFENLEVKAKQSMEKIRQEILETFTFKTALDQFGGEDGAEGALVRINQLVEQTGVSFNDIVDILRGDINPQTKDTLKIIQDIAAEDWNIADRDAETTKMKATIADILEQYEQAEDSQKAQADLAKANRDYLREQEGYARGVADETERAAEAAERLGAALGNAVRQAANLVFD